MCGLHDCADALPPLGGLLGPPGGLHDRVELLLPSSRGGPAWATSTSCRSSLEFIDDTHGGGYVLQLRLALARRRLQPSHTARLRPVPASASEPGSGTTITPCTVSVSDCGVSPE